MANGRDRVRRQSGIGAHNGPLHHLISPVRGTYDELSDGIWRIASLRDGGLGLLLGHCGRRRVPAGLLRLPGGWRCHARARCDPRLARLLKSGRPGVTLAGATACLHPASTIMAAGAGKGKAAIQWIVPMVIFALDTVDGCNLRQPACAQPESKSASPLAIGYLNYAALAAQCGKNISATFSNKSSEERPKPFASVPGFDLHGVRIHEYGALTGLTSSSVKRRKARGLAHRKIRGPFVAHPKFGPYSGIKPVPNETPCMDLTRHERGMRQPDLWSVRPPRPSD